MEPKLRVNELINLGFKERTIINYFQEFYTIIENSPSNLKFEDIYNEFTVKKETVKKWLKEYLRIYPKHIQKIIGFYPSIDTIIDLAESRVGRINGNNLFEVNIACKEIVDSITLPMHERYVKESLSSMGILTEDERIEADFDTIFHFLYEEYSDFLVGSGNGVVSIAGTMNEEILMRAMEAEGLERERDFKKSGKNSEADIILSGRLFCEVKSYKARERFLRGLKDIPHREKIGVGFFLDPSEFNPARTSTLLEANPMAIYLPDVTYDDLHEESKLRQTYGGDFLYRKLSWFVDDMKFYTENLRLPEFRTLN